VGEGKRERFTAVISGLRRVNPLRGSHRHDIFTVAAN
jgi:hypothetical protein